MNNNDFLYEMINSTKSEIKKDEMEVDQMKKKFASQIKLTLGEEIKKYNKRNNNIFFKIFYKIKNLLYLCKKIT